MGEVRIALIVMAVVAGLSPAAPARAGSAAVASWSFDTPLAGGGYRDSSGHGRELAPRARNGGRTGTTARAGGRAVVFPAQCRGGGCPRVVLEAADSAGLNPGTAPWRWGARIALRRSQTGAGENVLQKGFANGGGQYKLQVDGTAGRPSCVVVGTGAGRVHLAAAGVSVADGGWHAVECRRERASLTVLVDGAVRGRVGIPAGLAIRNGSPVRLGGKSTVANNDQFHGALDDAWIGRG
ncbi:hypothetical protein GCM10010123_15100 [Pilimelia anulata]|uniref:Lectin n=1 Tax=Pilimelia anulata TaxID=53371 RepID=A0A8J3B4X5_9ACTN|nr:laminin G domain-containing protein [Pilimelia anulata]GGJ86494.1 hypothetical protein GCM10010123_15100 [Pilimelia anulata]